MNNNTIKIKPAVPGQIVRDPETGQPLLQEGEEKTLTQHWRRALKMHNVVIVSAVAQQQTTETTSPKASKKTE